MDFRAECDMIVKQAIEAVLPDAAVQRALREKKPASGRTILIAVGKAAWSMGRAAVETPGFHADSGLIITKHGYSRGPVGDMEIIEAGHPLFDEASCRAAERALELTGGLKPEDEVIFLLSGGGSALFELPVIPAEELRGITDALLKGGADIVEINTIRKRLSAVKGGRFGLHCAPAKVFTVVLSDIIGDPIDMIASGPACPDSSTSADAERIVEKYGLSLSPEAMAALMTETPKALDNVTTLVTGSVSELCGAAKKAAEKLGYEAYILTDTLSTEARAAGEWLAGLALQAKKAGHPVALIAGGETVVHVHGKGLGGRNQELALAAADIIDKAEDIAVFSAGSDGTDGPTDAAGGFVDTDTKKRLLKKCIAISDALAENDSYHVLKAVDGLIFTGPTGTNVNDVAVALIRP